MLSIAELLARADALHRAGQLAEAEHDCRLALEAAPAVAQAHNLLGKIQGAAGRFEAAEASFRQAIGLAADYVEAHSNLGVTLGLQGKMAECAAAFRRAVELAPLSPELHRKLAGALAELGAHDEAVACCRRAVELDPNHAESHNSLGVLLERAQRLDEAVAALRTAVKLKPDFADAWNNLGAALEAQGNLDDAQASLARAIQLDPRRVGPYVNLSLVLEKQGRLAESLDVLARAAALDPRSTAVLVNRGLVLERQGKLDEAVAAFQRALEVDSQCAEAHLNYGLALLRSGDFSRGWREYEWRFQCQGAVDRLRGRPRWTGEPIEGRTILLCDEQGFGDALQFVRFAEPIKGRGARVIVLCRRPLVDLLKTCPGVDAVASTTDPLPEFDAYLPLASAPLVLGTSPDDIPAVVPYLFPDASRVESWRRELASVERLKVGIAWQGQPENKADRYRSIPLERFAALCAVGGVRLFSLQMGTGREQLAPSPLVGEITDLADRIRDFQDTAAIMANLDVVITCDSAPAHLAGALGVPVWVALPLVADWRWMHARSDSPWYPTMRLYRQSKLGDWQGLFERIARDLAALVRQRR